MNYRVAVNVSLGILTELLYAFAVILSAFAVCLVVSIFRP